MERNIKFTIRFKGTDYHGWQLQENADTVQAQMMRAIEKITGENVKLHGCSRTDSGVHANMFCCNARINKDIDCQKLMRGLNAVLGDDIGVYGCSVVHDGFHSRFDCVGKEYIYRIWNSECKNPFIKDTVLQYPYKLDEKMLDRQAAYFIGTHDFSAFCSSGTDVENKVRTIYSCNVKRDGELVTVTVSGDGFLYNMVRIIVGTLLDIQSGKIPEDSVPEIIASRDRNRSGVTAKADGLHLNKVYYDPKEVL